MKILVSTIVSTFLLFVNPMAAPAAAVPAIEPSIVAEPSLRQSVKKHKINLARKKSWEKIARCESGNRWHINTHNGHYGGLQFSLATWRSVGGRDFARYPHQASKAEQITVANRLYKRSGFKPWSCRHVLH